MNNSIFHIVKREFARFKVDRPMLWMFTLIPVVVFTIFCLIYSKGLLYDIPIAVLDEDHTEMSRTIARYADATPNLKVVKELNNIGEIESEIPDGEFYAVLYFPKGMEADVKKGQQANVGLYINSANIILGKLVYRYGVTLISTVSGGISVKQLKAAGKGEALSYRLANPINLSSRSLYNGTYNYLQYMAPGLMLVVLQMLVMFAGAMSINSEIKAGTFRDLVHTAKAKVLSIIIGKTIFYMLLSSILVLFIFGVLFPIFDIVINGSLFNTIVFVELFVLAAFLLGMFLSSAFPKPVMSLDLAFVYNSPAFLFSGFTFPIYGMPWYDQLYSKLVIFTYFQDGFFKLYQMNLPFLSAKNEISAMLVFVLIGLVGSIAMLYFRVKKQLQTDGFKSEGGLV